MNCEQWNYPYGPTLTSAVLKTGPQDFIVSEELGFDPDGEGEHLFLQIEKTGLSTPELVTRLARDYAISPRHIGFSGLKDKQAIATQWLSLHLPGKDSKPTGSTGEGYRVLRQCRHRSKLRRGTHQSNYFQIRLRELKQFPSDSRQQLDRISRSGFANYFGRQRFGRQQDNVDQALQQLGRPRLKRSRKSLLISSLRSFLFNAILSQRINRDYWEQPVPGDVFMLRGSHSIFVDEIDDEIRRRFDSMDISSCASLYGHGATMLSGKPLAIEQEIFERNPRIVECLEQQGSKRQMRAMRAEARDLQYDYDASESVLTLSLSLAPGCYLTSLLDHFVAAREN